MLEVEVKVRVSIDETLKKLYELGYKRGTTVYELDTYFNGLEKDLKKEDKALRIREHRDVDTGVTKYVLNFKGPKVDETTLTREETQFTVPSFEHGEIVLRGLGFAPAGHVEKTRIHMEKERVRCCLDSVTGLGDFLEVEIMAEGEDGYEKAVKEIEEVLKSLNLSMEDTVKHSYLSMLMK